MPFENNPELKTSLDYITDVFSGVDGGVPFFKFRLLLEQLDQQASTGDSAAQQLIEQVHVFYRLLKYAGETTLS